MNSRADIIFNNSKFNDFDQMAQGLLGWNLEINQLGGGRFQGEALQFGNRDLFISSGGFSRKTEQKGAQPPYARTLAITGDHKTNLVWRKKEVPANGLMVFPRGSEVDVVSSGGTKIITMSFSNDLLERACRALGLPDLYKALDQDDLFAVNPQAMDNLRLWMRNIGQVVRGKGGSAGLPAILAELEFGLPRRLMEILADPLPKKASPQGRVLKRVMNKVEGCLREHPREPVTVKDLCQAVSASERTLQYGFQKRFGIPPKQYLRARRLNGVRRELTRAGGEGELVGEAAARWGFWHLSQFSKDYRLLFGELPSETLAKHRGCLGGKMTRQA